MAPNTSQSPAPAEPNRQNTTAQKANPMWGGHFAEGPDAVMEALNASIHFDQKLYRQDIQGSRAHVEMLAACGIITESEAAQITDGLTQIEAEIERGELAFDPALEDIHMHIEARLKELIGDVAGKMHTARSRNDQVATDTRLYVRDAIDRIDGQLHALQATLVTRAEEHAESLMPGFTHLQIAQPVTLGHHLLAYVEMFARDRGRFADARTRLNECPLGSAALAGTPYPINRDQTTSSLGFDRPTANSLDAVSDRDYLLEFLSAASITAMHLSRLGEELVVWSTPQFGFITLSDRYTTGSSIMPQKRNPDAAELLRGKAGRMLGAYVSLLTVVKNLSLAYAKDLQEDKEPVFDVAEQLPLCLKAATGMVADMKVHRSAMRKACDVGFVTATDLADWLVRELGTPFRDAHHVTGKIVREAESRNCQLHEVPLEVMQQVEPRITKALLDHLTPEASAASRKSYGGTAPDNVRNQVKRWKKQLGEANA